MSEWWITLTGAEQVFYTIAITSSAVLVVQFILNLIGLAGQDMDMDTDSDFDVGADFDVGDDFDVHDTGLGMLSVRTVLAFFVGLGWTGVAMLGSGMPQGGSVIVALLGGAFFMFVVFWLMRTIYSLTESGNIVVASALGQTGTVYLPIPPQGQGTGQVQLVVQGRLRELPAVTTGEERLPTNTHVRVERVLDHDVLLVRRVQVEEEQHQM